MPRPFEELRGRMSVERQQRAELAAQTAMADLLMDYVRDAAGLGEAPDGYSISLLRHLIEGLGGKLEVVLRLPGGDIRLS